MAPCDGLGAVFLHCWHYKSDLPALPSAGVDREVMIMPFTAAELEEMRRADAEIEWNFRLTPEDLAVSRQRDRWAVFEALPPEKQRRAAYQRAYCEANREKLAAYQRAYREANREKRAAYQRWIHDARIARGFTQRDLAQMLGCSRQTISNLETGRARMDAFARADKLREILGRSSED